MSFKTDVTPMNQAASNVERVKDEVQGELSRLRGVVEDVSGSWKGQAQASFHSLMERWDENARDLNEALQSIADNIRSNAGDFDNTDVDNAAAFNA